MTTSETLHKVRLTINKKVYEAEVPARRTLVDMIRYDLGRR